jgi:hypothetical protein
MQTVIFAIGALTAAAIFAAGGALLVLSILIAWS